MRGLHPSLGVRHPILLGTSVKLDQGEYQQGQGAVFDNGVSLHWSRGDENAYELDGRTGMPYVADAKQTILGPSVLARVRLEAQAVEAERALGIDSESSKLATDRHLDAKALLEIFWAKHCAPACTLPR